MGGADLAADASEATLREPMAPDSSTFGSLSVGTSLKRERLQDEHGSRRLGVRNHGLVLAACLTAVVGLPGASWGANGAVRFDRPAAAPSSLPRVTEYDSLLVSRIDPGIVLLGTQRGLFRTTNGGRSWTPAGLRQEAVTSLSRVGPTIIAAGDDLLTLSTDGGKTWRRLHPRGLPNEDVVALGSDHYTIYVVLRGAGLYRSSDRGQTFRPVSFAVGPAIRALALTSSRIIAGDVVSGVYLSRNGREWLHTARGMIMGLAVGGEDREQVLAAGWGIVRSSDGGRRWRTALRSRVMFGAVAWAPGDPSLAYAVGDNRSFWRSADGGLHWRMVTNSPPRG
jgi:photosynthesis system II assembly factor YCF48-like protein